ncbi:MAG: sigma factor-like helix-turn-helix DNA-binding protein, partial [Gemmatimonadota bacterium]
IAEAIARLRPAYRACVQLRFIEDQSYEAIAEALDLPIGTVKTHLHRAKLELQALLRPLRPGGSSPSAPL